MTSTFSESKICVDCSGPMDEPPRSSSFSSVVGEPMLVLHTDGSACRNWIHEQCAEGLRRYGARPDNCPCGNGPAVDGILPETLGQTRSVMPESAYAHEGHATRDATLGGVDDSDSDDSDDDSDDAHAGGFNASAGGYGEEQDDEANEESSGSDDETADAEEDDSDGDDGERAIEAHYDATVLDSPFDRLEPDESVEPKTPK